ncbi:hypothetical protein PHYPSEUDO_013207 [Phytophthora pseudosyringae]|uniref:Uncharacterized protein n=1 Tax=Phytophthora pseudosyringae TaxID=221518 RepID=A0A8T1V6G6_9STRA|nr:hypothetical protein PHYPSEUDO_013207 [Phytophthora pseudosyringae]
MAQCPRSASSLFTSSSWSRRAQPDWLADRTSSVFAALRECSRRTSLKSCRREPRSLLGVIKATRPGQARHRRSSGVLRSISNQKQTHARTLGAAAGPVAESDRADAAGARNLGGELVNKYERQPMCPDLGSTKNLMHIKR